ncbi:hypothetical protein BG004_003517, partial [Podila humilis]
MTAHPDTTKSIDQQHHHHHHHPHNHPRDPIASSSPPVTPPSKISDAVISATPTVVLSSATVESITPALPSPPTSSSARLTHSSKPIVQQSQHQDQTQDQDQDPSDFTERDHDIHKNNSYNYSNMTQSIMTEPSDNMILASDLESSRQHEHDPSKTHSSTSSTSSISTATASASASASLAPGSSAMKHVSIAKTKSLGHLTRSTSSEVDSEVANALASGRSIVSKTDWKEEDAQYLVQLIERKFPKGNIIWDWVGQQMTSKGFTKNQCRSKWKRIRTKILHSGEPSNGGGKDRDGRGIREQQELDELIDDEDINDTTPQPRGIDHGDHDHDHPATYSPGPDFDDGPNTTQAPERRYYSNSNGRLDGAHPYRDHSGEVYSSRSSPQASRYHPSDVYYEDGRHRSEHGYSREDENWSDHDARYGSAQNTNYYSHGHHRRPSFSHRQYGPERAYQPSFSPTDRRRKHSASYTNNNNNSNSNNNSNNNNEEGEDGGPLLSAIVATPNSFGKIEWKVEDSDYLVRLIETKFSSRKVDWAWVATKMESRGYDRTQCKSRWWRVQHRQNQGSHSQQHQHGVAGSSRHKRVHTSEQQMDQLHEDIGYGVDARMDELDVQDGDNDNKGDGPMLLLESPLVSRADGGMMSNSINNQLASSRSPSPVPVETKVDTPPARRGPKGKLSLENDSPRGKGQEHQKHIEWREADSRFMYKMIEKEFPVGNVVWSIIGERMADRGYSQTQCMSKWRRHLKNCKLTGESVYGNSDSIGNDDGPASSNKADRAFSADIEMGSVPPEAVAPTATTTPTTTTHPLDEDHTPMTRDSSRHRHQHQTQHQGGYDYDGDIAAGPEGGSVKRLKTSRDYRGTRYIIAPELGNIPLDPDLIELEFDRYYDKGGKRKAVEETPGHGRYVSEARSETGGHRHPRTEDSQPSSRHDYPSHEDEARSSRHRHHTQHHHDRHDEHSTQKGAHGESRWDGQDSAATTMDGHYPDQERETHQARGEGVYYDQDVHRRAHSTTASHSEPPRKHNITSHSQKDGPLRPPEPRSSHQPVGRSPERGLVGNRHRDHVHEDIAATPDSAISRRHHHSSREYDHHTAPPTQHSSSSRHPYAYSHDRERERERDRERDRSHPSSFSSHRRSAQYGGRPSSYRDEFPHEEDYRRGRNRERGRDHGRDSDYNPSHRQNPSHNDFNDFGFMAEGDYYDDEMEWESGRWVGNDMARLTAAVARQGRRWDALREQIRMPVLVDPYYDDNDEIYEGVRFDSPPPPPLANDGPISRRRSSAHHHHHHHRHHSQSHSHSHSQQQHGSHRSYGDESYSTRDRQHRSQHHHQRQVSQQYRSTYPSSIKSKQTSSSSGAGGGGGKANAPYSTVPKRSRGSVGGQEQDRSEPPSRHVESEENSYARHHDQDHRGQDDDHDREHSDHHRHQHHEYREHAQQQQEERPHSHRHHDRGDLQVIGLEPVPMALPVADDDDDDDDDDGNDERVNGEDELQMEDVVPLAAAAAPPAQSSNEEVESMVIEEDRTEEEEGTRPEERVPHGVADSVGISEPQQQQQQAVYSRSPSLPLPHSVVVVSPSATVAEDTTTTNATTAIDVEATVEKEDEEGQKEEEDSGSMVVDSDVGVNATVINDTEVVV